MTRYVIVGAGAVGACLAVELADRGHEVLLIARGATLEQLAAQPLSYHTHAGERQVRLPVAAIGDDLGLRLGDILVLAVKTQDVAGAAAELAWRDVVDRQGGVLGTAAELVPIVTVQNGLDAERAAARWFETVIGAVFMISAQYVRVGEVRVGGYPAIGAAIAGVAAGDPATGEQTLKTVVADLRAANFGMAPVADIRAYKAAKILHSVRNGVEVLAGDRSAKQAVGDALVAEARRVLAAAGIAHHETEDLVLDPDQESFSEASGVRRHRQSTWQSFARGAGGHEADYLNGEIALLARLHGTDAPLNARLQQLLGRAARHGGGLEQPGLDLLLERIAGS
ncbi:ketopantoate reductase family protein [Nocardia sp. BMG111209]|uniref:ketopantoate reductase family protein n=1 Tax=Nocardia sp. BMG111209 TaxID=1160137 RepID=UPI000363803B|nr:2-dehydropantoate 2-reductase N-terminal domain-containing protein [Nocardia sp. BMG111209]